tara:strand:+ start:133 stop:360 length:228 start_codon:yes stop_codon:yes gene_type:complete
MAVWKHIQYASRPNGQEHAKHVTQAGKKEYQSSGREQKREYQVSLALTEIALSSKAENQGWSYDHLHQFFFMVYE